VEESHIREGSEEKTRASGGVLRTFPKHKGAEKLEKAVKRQIAGLKEEIAERARRKGARIDPWRIPKEEDLLLGVMGGSEACAEFFMLLSGRDVRFFDVFAHPVVGSFKSLGVVIQLVLLPYSPDLSEPRKRVLARMLSQLDGVILVPRDGREAGEMIELIESLGFSSFTEKKYVAVRVLTSGGIRVIGLPRFFTYSEVEQLLREYGTHNAVVEVSGNATLDDVEEEFLGIKKLGLVVHRGGEPLPEELMRSILALFGLIRIFTKAPTGEVSVRALLLREGSRVIDAASKIHKELVEYFHYAKVYRSEDQGLREIRVGRNFELRDGDVLTILARF